MLAVCNVKDYDKSTKLLASTTLRFVYNVKKLFFNVISLFVYISRTILGTKSLAEILSDRETIAVDILENLDTATDPWGIQVWYYTEWAKIWKKMCNLGKPHFSWKSKINIFQTNKKFEWSGMALLSHNLQENSFNFYCVL